MKVDGVDLNREGVLVQMKDNLLERFINSNEYVTVRQAQSYLKNHPHAMKMLERISGQEAYLNFVEGAAYEEKEGNTWLPDTLFDSIVPLEG